MSDPKDNNQTSMRRLKPSLEPTSGAEIGTSKSTPTTEVEPMPTKRPSKSSLVLQMLQRSEGTTIAQIVTATGWQPHTTRAALTGLKKKGHDISSEKTVSKERVYKVAAC